MDLMRSWVDIEEGRGERSAYCVMMNVRVLVMFCRSVQSTVVQEMAVCVSCRRFLWMDLNVSRAWVIEKHLLCWVVSCGRMTLVYLPDLGKDDMVDVWVLES